MSKKVTNVRVEKKKLMMENFKKKGMPELLSEVSFKFDTSKDTTEKMLKKFISAIKKKFKKEFHQLSIKERETYFTNIQINDGYSVEIKKFQRDEDPKFYDYIVSLLKRSRPKSERRDSNDVFPVKVIIKANDDKIEGFSMLDGEVSAPFHRTTRAFIGSKYDYQFMVDMPSLIAETIAIQSLFDFSIKNKELVQYLLVKSFMDTPEFSLLKKVKRVPIEKTFQKDFLATATKHGFAAEDFSESGYIDKLRNIFYFQTLDIGSTMNSITRNPLLNLVVEEFVKQSDYIQYKTSEEIKERSDYARSFQTKKAIKQSHLDKMKNNAFLHRYGFTELDNDVDLKKFKVLEENFIELFDTIHIPYRKDYSFRIKKLGHHKAAGVFFPYYRATIFDPGHPSAYVHELGHQIDFMLAENLREDYYSETMEFRSILDKYKKLVNASVSELEETDEFRKTWYGATKYNSSYYFKPTEIFARSYEIYLTQKGIESSLLKTEEELSKEVVYPVIDEYVDIITMFFDDLLEKLAIKYPIKTKKQTKKHVASPKIYEEITHTFGSEQLSFFD